MAQNIGNLSNLFKEYINSDRRKIFVELYKDFDIYENENFSKNVMKKFDELKTYFFSLFNKYQDQIIQNYEEFKKNLLCFIDDKEKKFENLFDPLISQKSIFKYSCNNIFKKIDNTLEILNNIINNIEQNIKLLNVFFEQNNIIDNKKQAENFLIKNSKLIENCSIVNKFNFKEIDIKYLNQVDYYKFYIKYLSEKKKEKKEISKNFLLKKEKWKEGIEFIQKNFSFLEKLKLEEINNDDEFKSILKNIVLNIKDKNEINLKTLYLKNFGTITIKIGDSKLNIIKKLKVQRGAYIHVLTITKLFIEANTKLESLSLDYINMTDTGFKFLISSLIKNPNITNTLKYLSLEGNRITQVKYNRQDINNQAQFFQNLNFLNLSKNGIYKFEFSLRALPNLKFLDLTSNKISNGFFKEGEIENEIKDKLVLLNDNILITNDKNNNNIYINYLDKIVPIFDFEIKNLNLNFSYTIENENNLEHLKLATNVAFSLINLDLSFCGLHTDVLVNFFKNNPKFIFLKNLNLKYNNIKEDFFEKIISNKEIFLDNINFIDLSENSIACERLEKINNLAQFIEKYQNLKNIQLINTGFFTNLIDSIKNVEFKDVFINLKKYLEENQRDFKFIINERNATFIDKEFGCYFSFK